MRLKLISYLILILYFVITSVLAVLTDLDLWATTVLLLLVPTVWFLWRLRPPLSLFLPVGLSAVSTTLLFESIAYTSGLWYELSIFETRVLGIFPVEILLWNFALQLFIVSVYEYFTDDRQINRIAINWKNIWLLGFVLLVAFIDLLFATAMSKTVLPFALWWLLLGVLVSLAGAILLSHRHSRLTFKKALVTTLLLSPFLLFYEAVSLLNFHWVFANSPQYVQAFNLFGEILPIERLLLMLLTPLWLVIVYESYLDDGQ